MCNSRIIISSNLQRAKEFLLNKIDSNRVQIYETNEFKVEDSKEVLKEAYIAEDSCKYLIMIANSYNIYAQNSLLKLFEEPPRNIAFIVVARSKSSLLPTIRSRMQIKVLKNEKQKRNLNLNLNRLDLAMIFSFLKENKNLAKDDLKEVIETLLMDALVIYNYKLTQKELNQYNMALELADLNSRPQNILSPLLLTLLQAKARQN
jgi:DNA polymerase-3 subunit delta'